MLSKILRGAVLATLAVGATVAQADPFGATATGSLDFEGHSDGWKQVNSWAAGQFKGYFPNGDLHLNNDFFRFFCIDLSHIAHWNPVPYSRSEVTDSTKIGYLTELFERHYPLGSLGNSYYGTGLGDFAMQTIDGTSYSESAQSAAMQLAIWEIWEDSGSTLNFDTGNFLWTGGDGNAKTLASKYLEELSSPTPYDLAHKWTFYEFKNTENSQNYLSATYTPKTSNEPPNRVPLPGTLALLGIGLAGLGLARRKS